MMKSKPRELVDLRRYLDSLDLVGVLEVSRIVHNMLLECTVNATLLEQNVHEE